MPKSNLLNTIAFIPALFFAFLSTCNAGDATFMPAIKSAQDLPRRAEFISVAPLMANHPDSAAAAVRGSVAVGTKAYILQKKSSYAQVLIAKGETGWVQLGELNEVPSANVQEYQHIAKAIGNPAAQAALDPQQTQLLQAALLSALVSNTWGLQDSSLDRIHAMQEEVAALTWVRSRNMTSAWPLLLQRWEDQFFAEMGDEYYEGWTSNESAFDWGNQYPGLIEALSAGGEIERQLCKRLKKEESSTRLGYYFGEHGTGGNMLFLSLIKSLQQRRPLSDCMVAALKKIAATNLVGLRSGAPYYSVEQAVDLLKAIQPTVELEKWASALAKQPMPTFGANYALALLKLENVNIQPHVTQLVLLASSKSGSTSGDALAAQHLALWALATRAPSKRVDELLRAALMQQDADPQLRIDALRLLAQRPLEPGLRELAVKLVKELAKPEPSRLKQLAVDLLASEALSHDSQPFLQTLMDDRDSYIRSVALRSVRNETLHRIKATRSLQERSKIRGKYLEALRRQVDQLTTPSDDLSFKKSPLWMLKPHARLSIQLSGDALLSESQKFPRADIEMPPSAEPSPLTVGSRLQDFDDPPRMPEVFAIHPGKVLFKYGSMGRKRTLAVTVQLDDLVVDGKDLVPRAMPAIYVVTLNWPDGTTTRYAWYCEPDDAFWSDAGLDDSDGGG